MKIETAAQYTRRVTKNGIKAKKALGQNFLIDDDVIDRIVEYGVPAKDAPVIEIGPGPGGLTRVLAERCSRLWAVELDTEKVELLNKEFKRTSLQVLHMDALELNLKDIWNDEKGWLVGNLPYYITNPLIMHFLEQGKSLHGMTVMVQKEVAERMTAQPGSKKYGILSIAVQLFSDAEKLFDVPPSAFIPQPKVTSSVVRLTIRDYPGFNEDPRLFFKVVKAAFAQRRKTLLNTLAAGLNINKDTLGAILRQANIDERLRPEDIGIPEYITITRLLGQYNNP